MRSVTTRAARSVGGNKDRALVKLRPSVAAFEQERAQRSPAGLGRGRGVFVSRANLLEHGDAVAARDALEHALLLAPEYVQARAQMAKIASG